MGKLRALCMDLGRKTARQVSLLECIDKTRIMCNQFNYAVADLRNQIDTTDAYIENFLPFRTIKELTALLSDAFDGPTVTKIKRFEAKRVKDLYYRILTKINEVPNFK